jgi:HEAT repeat protein
MIHYCPHCWQEIPAGADPCPHCGETTDETGLTFVERLLRTLRHPEPTRAGLAIDILAERLRDPRAVEPLIGLLSESTDAAILKQAARGLGLLGDPKAVPPLVQLLGDPEVAFVVRCEAAFALGTLGGKDAEAALRAAVDDPRPSVSRAARQALAVVRLESSA